MHIAIEGVCGSGKTTFGEILEKPPLRFRLLKNLSKDISIKFFQENIANPYLKDFYNKSLRQQYSFFSQSFFLHARVIKYINIVQFKGIALEDRSLFGDFLFAKNLYLRNEMSEESFNLYQEEKKILTKYFGVRNPAGIIFLDIPLSTCMMRLKERNTGEDLDEKYWGDLLNLYKAEFKQLSKKIPTIFIDASIDFFRDEDYVERVADEANKLIRKVSLS